MTGDQARRRQTGRLRDRQAEKAGTSKRQTDRLRDRQAERGTEDHAGTKKTDG